MFSKVLVHKGKLKEIYKVGKDLHKKVKAKKKPSLPAPTLPKKKSKGKLFPKLALGAGALAGAGITYREYKHYKESGEASPEGKQVLELLEGVKEEFSKHLKKIQ